MSTPNEIVLTKEEGVATIMLNRPHRRNAFTTSMISAWVDALVECREDDAIKVIIITGAGTAFCSGGDLETLGEQHTVSALERKNTLWKQVHLIPKTLQTIDKPVIAAINGVATGAGLDIALMCDLRIASEQARMAELYVKVGLVPETEAPIICHA